MLINRVPITRFWLSVAAALTMLGGQLLVAQPAVAGELEQPPKIVGLASQDFANDADVYASHVGQAPEVRQLFWSLEHDWPNAWAPAQLDDLEAIGASAYVEITSYDLDGLVNGAEDAVLGDLVATIKGWLDRGNNRHIMIAPILPDTGPVTPGFGLHFVTPGSDPIRCGLSSRCMEPLHPGLRWRISIRATTSLT